MDKYMQADAQCEGLIRLPAGLPSVPIGFLITTLKQLHGVITTMQGSHVLCGIWHIEDVKHLWHHCPVGQCVISSSGEL